MSSSQNNPFELLAMDENRNESLTNRGYDSIRAKSFKSTVSDNTNDNIIYEKDDYLVTTGKEEEEAISYCGISSDGLFACILNVITSTLGQGCLSFPYVLQQLGLYLTIFIFILVSVSVYFANDLLRSFVVDTKYFSFALMTNEILGKNWLKIYAISSLIYYSVIEINYLTFMHEVFIVLIDDKYKIAFSIIYLIITTIIEIFVCSYIFNPKKIHILSLVTIVCFIIIILTIIIGTINNLINGNAKDLNYGFFTPEYGNPWEFISNIFSIIIQYLYGYSYNSSLPTLLGNMKNLDNKNSKKIHLYSFLILCLLYIVLFFFGYLICENTDEYLFDSMDMFGNNDNIFKNFLVYFCKTIFWFYLFIEIPMRFIVIRDNYSSLVKERMTPKKDLLVTSICILLYNLTVFFLTSNNIITIDITGIFIELFGGIFGVIIGFCLPVVNYVAVNGKKKLKSIIGYILIGFYGIIGLTSVGYSLVKLKIGE